MPKKSEKKESLPFDAPFDARSLKDMTNSEFYLEVYDYKNREQMCRELKQKGNISKESIDALWAVNGRIGEMISRKQGACEYYHLSALSKVLLPDGTPLGKQIRNNIIGLYVFRMESVQIQDGRPPILTGSAQHYYISRNRVSEPLEQKITLHFAYTPTQKTKMGLLMA